MPAQKVSLNKALIKAITQDDTKGADSSIKLGADANTSDAHGEPALILAAENGNDAITSVLLEQGASINARGIKATTALITAAVHAHTSTVRLLLDKGADPKLRDSWSETALMWATLNPFAEEPIAATVKVLVSKGADVNAVDKNGSSPLMNATLCNHSTIVKLLLGLGADVNAATTNGTTALMQSAEDGTGNITKLLLSRNADGTLKNASGKTALDLATEDNNTNIVRILSAVKSDTKAVPTVPAQKQSAPETTPVIVSQINPASLPMPIREEVEAVHVGMTRAEFDKHFWHLPGLGSYFVDAVYFCREQNWLVSFTVTFKAFDPAARAASHAKEIKYHGIYWPAEMGQTVYMGSPRDTIVKVSPPSIVSSVPKAP